MAAVESMAQSIGQVGTIKSTKLDDNGIYTFVPAKTNTGKQKINLKNIYLNLSKFNGTFVQNI